MSRLKSVLLVAIVLLTVAWVTWALTSPLVSEVTFEHHPTLLPFSSP